MRFAGIGTVPHFDELNGGRSRSTGSAAAETALFARFRATSGRSDFSIALIVGYGLRPSRQPPGHDWRGGRWRSPGSRAKGFCACQGLRRRGASMRSCDIDARRVAFCETENIGTPNLSYAAQYLACALPCERFASALASIITRGRCGSLRLHRDGLPPSTFCRSPGAPVHPRKQILLLVHDALQRLDDLSRPTGLLHENHCGKLTLQLLGGIA